QGVGVGPHSAADRRLLALAAAGDGEAHRRADGKLVAGILEHLGDLSFDHATARAFRWWRYLVDGYLHVERRLGARLAVEFWGHQGVSTRCEKDEQQSEACDGLHGDPRSLGDPISGAILPQSALGVTCRAPLV